MLRPLATVVAFVVALSLSAAASVAGTFLKVDFGNSPVQSGFQGFPADPTTYPTSEGNITIESFNDTGAFNRNGVTNGGALTFADLYNDFYHFNNGPFQMTISGLIPNQAYRPTFYSYDEDGSSSVITQHFIPISGTIGPVITVTYTMGVDPTANDQYSASAFWLANGSGEIQFEINTSLVGPGGLNRINGLELFIPEPASMSLVGLGGLMLLRRRRA